MTSSRSKFQNKKVVWFLPNDFFIAFLAFGMFITKDYLYSVLFTIGFIIHLISLILCTKVKKYEYDNKKFTFSLLFISYLIIFIGFITFSIVPTNYEDNIPTETLIQNELERKTNIKDYINATVIKNDKKFAVTLNLNSSETDVDNLATAYDIISSIKILNYTDIDLLVSDYNFNFYENNVIKYKISYKNDLKKEISNITITNIENVSKSMTSIEIEEYIKKKEEQIKQQEIKEFKQDSQSYKYKDILRNPDEYLNKKIYYFAEVMQVIDEYSYLIQINCEKNQFSDSGYICNDIIYMEDYNSSNLLETDMINIWGTFEGTYSYYNALNIKQTVPKIEAKYIELK